MTYVIDAYNVIHAVPEFEKELDRDLKTARDALILFCIRVQKVRGDIGKIIIVFDGCSEVGEFGPEGNADVSVIYSETDEDADDRIVSVLEGLKNRQQVTVVSNDNYVCNSARAYRVKSMSARDFVDFADRKNRKPESSREPLPDRETERDITDEYRRHLGID